MDLFNSGTTTWTWEYNDDNRLVRSSGPEGIQDYQYNGLGFLSTVVHDGQERHYMVDPFGLGNIMAEYDAAGTLINRYAHGLGLISANSDFYTFDGNGNTSELTDPTGTTVNKYLYDPFGGSLYASETRTNDFEFVGQLGVMNLGNDLLYMRNRFYSPNLGRFMSEDPIGLAGGDVSFYRYVGNDPVNWVDPDGLLNSETGVSPSDLIDVGVAAATTAGVRAGIISPILAAPLGGPIGLATAPLSDFLLPSSLNDNEDFELRMQKLDLELFEINQQLQDIIDQWDKIFDSECD